MRKSRSLQSVLLTLVAALLALQVGCGNSDGSAGSSLSTSTDSTAADSAAADTAASTTDGVAGDDGATAACTAAEQLNLYERRIKPLVDGSQPSSCNQ